MNRIFLIFFLAIFSFASCKKNTPDVELILDKSELILNIGEKGTILVLQAPSTGETVEWTSDDKTIASVFYGTVTALGSGTTTITASVGDQAAKCSVTVPERTYELVWSEDFDGPNLNSDHWTYEIGTGNSGWGNNEEQYYTNRSENIRIENGCLVIEALKEEYEGSHYTSARIKTAGKKEFAYGKVEVRLQVPSGVGTWPAFWMLGTQGGWPDCGEIDIMEHVGFDPKTFHCALHTKNKNGMNGQNFKASQTIEEDAANDFHVITMEWVEQEFMGYDRIHIYVDGVETVTWSETSQLQDSDDWPFNNNFFFITNLALGGNWGGTIDDSIFDNPVQYKIDYIRVYQFQ